MITILDVPTPQTDHVMRMQNAQAARELLIGSGWSHIRIGLHFQLTAPEADIVGSPMFAFGLQAGSSDDFTNPAHFLGVGFAASQQKLVFNDYMERFGHRKVYMATTAKPVVFRKIGSTVAVSPSSDASDDQWAISSEPLYKVAVYLDITKGSPNFSIFAKYPSTTDILEFPIDRGEYDEMMAGVYNPPGYLTTNTKAVAIDEGANGDLDTVVFYWSKTSAALDVSAVSVAQYA
jgi:hypothetical protein